LADLSVVKKLATNVIKFLNIGCGNDCFAISDIVENYS